MISSLVSSLLILASAVAFDAERHTVTLEVVSPDPGLDTPLEFFIVGKGSDHTYEAMFETVAEAEAVAAAFKAAGFGKGTPCDDGSCRFVPIGDQVEIEPALTNFVRNTRFEPWPVIVDAGGTRNPDGSAAMATNMPLSVFAFYNLPQSLVQFGEALLQGETYGRFMPAVKLAKGERRTITFTLQRGTKPATIECAFNATNLSTVVKKLQAESAKGALVVVPSFEPSMTLKTAIPVARMLDSLDATGAIRVNGFKDGEFYFRAYLPLEAWRDRHQRLSQPVEIRLGKTAAEDRMTFISEDWSEVGAKDPKLVVKEFSFAEGLKELASSKLSSCLIFASSDTTLERLYTLKRALPAGLKNFYVYP